MINTLAIFGLYFILIHTEGPWGIFSKIRAKILNSRFQVFFFKLFECPVCMGFHCGWMIYLFQMIHFSFFDLLIWGCMGSTICLIGNVILDKLGSS